MFKFKIGWNGISYHGEHPVRDGFGLAIGCTFAMGAIYGTYRGVKYFFDNVVPPKKINIKEDKEEQEEDQDCNQTSGDKPGWKTVAEIKRSPKAPYSGVQLLGKLFRPGEVLFLYSQDGLGKSTLAAQWGYEILNGMKSQIFSEEDNVPTPPSLNVFVYDVENEEIDIDNRFFGVSEDSVEGLSYKGLDFDNIEDLEQDMIKTAESSTKSALFILDNLSCLTTDTLTADDFKRLLKAFNRVKEVMKSKGLFASFILVGHSLTSGTGKNSKDYLGSSSIGNLTPLRVTLLPTRFGNDIVMLKVKKIRNEKKPDDVLLLRRVSEPYLHFEYHNRCKEEEAAPIDGRTSCSFDTDDTETDVFKMSKAQLKKMEMIEEARQINELMLEGILNKKELSVRIGKNEKGYKTVERRIKEFHLPDPEFNSKYRGF